jgi:hypothetical protein
MFQHRQRIDPLRLGQGAEVGRPELDQTDQSNGYSNASTFTLSLAKTPTSNHAGCNRRP